MDDRDETLSDDTRARIARLWMQAQATVASFLAAAIHHASDVDDLLQEVAVKVAVHFDRYDPDRPFVNWAIGIARHELLAFLRDRGRDAMSLDPAVVSHLADASVHVHERVGDVHVALESCLAKLDDRARRAIHLRYDQGGSLNDVATQLDLSPAAAALLYRVRAALARCIERALGKLGASP